MQHPHVLGLAEGGAAPAWETPKKHHGKAILMDYVFAISIATVYVSFLVCPPLCRVLMPAAPSSELPEG